jgi:hypothetical protein
MVEIWHSYIIKTFTFSFFYRKLNTHQQDTISEEHKIIKNEYIFNDTKQWFKISAERLLRNQIFWVVTAWGWVISILRFEEIYRIHLQGYESLYRFTALYMKALRSFETSESSFPVYETSFLKNKCNVLRSNGSSYSWRANVF